MKYLISIVLTKVLVEVSCPPPPTPNVKFHKNLMTRKDNNLYQSFVSYIEWTQSNQLIDKGSIGLFQNIEINCRWIEHRLFRSDCVNWTVLTIRVLKTIYINGSFDNIPETVPITLIESSHILGIRNIGPQPKISDS